ERGNQNNWDRRNQAADSRGDRSGQRDGGRQMTPRPRSAKSPAPSLGFLGNLSKVLKWIVFAVLAIVVAGVLLRSGLGFLASFTSWARNLLAALRSLWDQLFGRKKKSETQGDSPEVVTWFVPPESFSSFSDPFIDGSARKRSPEELLRYSFAALHSWAWEHGQGRSPEETPIEFARRLAMEFPALETEVQRLAVLYA